MAPATPPTGRTAHSAKCSTTPARRYGWRYAATAELVLPELAVLIMADLVHAGTDPDDPVPARIRYAADVFPAGDLIHFWVYGLTDAELNAPFDPPAEAGPCPVDYPEIIDSVAQVSTAGRATTQLTSDSGCTCQC